MASSADDRDGSRVRTAMDSSKDATAPLSPSSPLPPLLPTADEAVAAADADADVDAARSSSSERSDSARKKDEARVLSQLLLLLCSNDRLIHDTNSDIDDSSDTHAREHAAARDFLTLAHPSQQKVAQALFVLQPTLLANFASVLQFFLRVVIAAHAHTHTDADTDRDTNDLPCAWRHTGTISCIERIPSSDATASLPTEPAAAMKPTTTAFHFPPAFAACVVARFGSAQRSKCDAVWHGDHMAYRCRTCGLSDSSCMCLACFDPDMHDGHDYRVYRCSSGGCCDCGDPLAWRPDGFCSKHAARDDRTSQIKPGLVGLERDVVALLVRRSVAFIVNVLREVHLFCLRPGGAYDRDPFHPMRALPKTGRRRDGFPDALRVYIDRVQLTLAWLELLATTCVAYRELLIAIFFEPLPSDFELEPVGLIRSFGSIDSSSSLVILDVFLRAGVLLPVETCDALGVLWLKLLFDQAFKAQYTCHFVAAYPHFVALYLRASDENNDDGMRALARFIDRLFCQLFHSAAQLQALERTFADTHKYALATTATSHKHSCVEALVLLLLEQLDALFRGATRTETIAVVRHALLPDAGRHSSTASSSGPDQMEFETGTTQIDVADCGRSVVKKRVYARLCSDLRTLLVHPTVAAAALRHSFVTSGPTGALALAPGPSVYRALLETFAALQQMDLQQRCETTHIEYESQHWTAAFVVDYEVTLLLAAFVAAVPLLFDAIGDDAAVRQTLAIALLTPVRDRVLQWTRASGCPTWSRASTDSSDNEPLDLAQAFAFYDSRDDTAMPVKRSFHLPLHHLYAALLHAVGVATHATSANDWRALFGCTAVSDTGSSQTTELDDLELALSVAEFPLRVCALAREVKTSQWVRNGHAMWQQLTHYCAKHWRFFGLHNDVFVCQLAALAAPRGRFTRALLHHLPVRLCVVSVETNVNKSEDDGIRHESAITEELLRLVLTLLLAPVKTATAVAPAASASALLNRELAHWLSLGPSARSDVLARVDAQLVELVKQTPKWRDHDDEEVLAHALESVGVYDEPVGSSGTHLLQLGLKMSGTWRLRPERWTTVSPFFECFTPAEAQQCEQNLRAAAAASSSSSSTSASGPTLSPLVVPVLPALEPNVRALHAALAAQLVGSRNLLAVLWLVVFNWQRRRYSRDVAATESLLLVALQCVSVSVELFDTPNDDDEDDDAAALAAHNTQAATRLTRIGAGARVDDVATHFCDGGSLFVNLCATVALDDELSSTSSSTPSSTVSLLSLLLEFAAATDAPALADARALVQQIVRTAGAKSALCRAQIDAAAVVTVSTSTSSKSSDGIAVSTDAAAAREQMRQRQQLILARMRSQQQQFLSAHGEVADTVDNDSDGCASATDDAGSDASDSDSSDGATEADDDDNEDDEWGFPTGHVDVQLYLEHVASAIALTCERERRRLDQQRRLRRSTRSLSDRSSVTPHHHRRRRSRSSSTSALAAADVSEALDDNEHADAECGLCRLPCNRLGAPLSFGYVGMVVPTRIPHKLRALHALQTPALPSVRTDDDTQTLALSDASVWSCGHALHHACLASYLASLWPSTRTRDATNGDDRLLSERDVEFQCPSCRRLSNCLVPNVAAPMSVPSHDTTAPLDAESTAATAGFVMWLRAQMSVDAAASRRKSQQQATLRARLDASATDRECLSAAERSLQQFFRAITRRCVRAALSLPLLLDATVRDERAVEAVIERAIAAIDAQLPPWQLFAHCIAVQVELLAHERAVLQLAADAPLDRRRLQSLQQLADVAVAASAMSMHHGLSWAVVDAPHDAQFDVVVAQLSTTLFGHCVLFEDVDSVDSSDGRAVTAGRDYRGAHPVLSHPDLFALFVARLVWRRGASSSPETVVAEAFYLARVLVTAQVLQTLCAICLDATDSNGGPDSVNDVASGDFARVQSVVDAHRWVARLLARCRLTDGSVSSASIRRRDLEQRIGAACLPLLQRIVLLMDVLLPSGSSTNTSASDGATAQHEPCAVCDGVFGAVSSSSSDTSDSEPSSDRALAMLLRQLHLPPLRLFFRAHVFAPDQRALCELWAAQLEAKAAVLRRTPSGPPSLVRSLSASLALALEPTLSVASPSSSIRQPARLLMALPRIYMTLFIAYSDAPRGVCATCRTVPPHPALCLLCGVVLCCFSPCCESARGSVGECTQHAQTCGLGVSAFLLLRACTVILFLGNDRRCVWGSVYVDRNGEEDPYLRRGRALFRDDARVLALETLLLSHGFAQNTAILANTSRRDGRRY